MKEKNRKRVSTKDKKLNLNMKTVRILNAQELRDVAGGQGVGTPPPTSPAAGSGGCGG